MTIVVTCPHCQSRLTLKDEFAGRRGACPKCKGAIQVPAAQSQPEPQSAGAVPTSPPGDMDAPLRVNCPQCGKVLQGRASMAGKRVKCPACGQVLVLPGATPDSPSMRPVAGASTAASNESSWFDQAMDESVLAKPPPSREPLAAAANPYLAPASTVGSTLPKRRALSDDDRLTALDWTLVIVVGWLACILGIVWMIQGRPKGGKMIGAVVLVSVAWGVVVISMVAFMLFTM